MTINLILASAYQDKVAYWKQGLNGFVSTALVIDKLGALREEVARIKPTVLLLDFDLLESNGATSLRSICADTNTIVIGDVISENMEWELLKVGVRGCCRSDSDPQFLKQVIEAVQLGELWIRRTLTCRLIDELGRVTAKNKAYRTSLGMLNKLTQREYDIAIRVRNGQSNKQIARACAITERTVKAHLTEVFLKLGVADRLNLALVLSADERNGDFGKSDRPLLGGSRFNDVNFSNLNAT